MDHIKYSNIAKALVHCHNNVHSFYSDISTVFERQMMLIRFQLYVDDYETNLSVTTDSSNNNNTKIDILKMRLVRFHKMTGQTWDETIKLSSYCNTFGWDGEKPKINYIELDPNNINLYKQKKDMPHVNINNIEEQHFQESTVQDIGEIEQYYYMRDMYCHYHEFIPKGIGFMCRYDNDERWDNDEFREFVAKKVWGIIALT